MRSTLGHARRTAVATLIVPMLLAGCGGDDDGTSADTAITTSAPAPTSTTTTAAGGQAAGGTSPGSCDGSIGAETESNSPAPTGRGNRVEGDKQEQCAGL